MLFEEGTIEIINGTYQYHYFIKDHLGNTRVVCKPAFIGTSLQTTPTVVQRNDYYPFGMLHGGLPAQEQEVTDNHYLYNGKETQARKFTNNGIEAYTNLNWLYFGFRFYDPTIGRFPSLDPLADKFAWVSPYNYAENSPVANIDLWGLQKLDYKTHFAINQGNPVSASLSYFKDFLHDFMSGGTLPQKAIPDYVPVDNLTRDVSNAPYQMEKKVEGTIKNVERVLTSPPDEFSVNIEVQASGNLLKAVGFTNKYSSELYGARFSYFLTDFKGRDARYFDYAGPISTVKDKLSLNAKLFFEVRWYQGNVDLKDPFFGGTLTLSHKNSLYGQAEFLTQPFYGGSMFHLRGGSSFGTDILTKNALNVNLGLYQILNSQDYYYE